VRLPANQLAVWAHLESDRLLNPVFREFHSERDVVHEERRLRTDNEPRGLFGEMFNSVAYTAHPYRNPVVGWSSDIDATVHGEVLAYFRSYYAPNNCVCVLVGDVEPKETIALLERTFGRIPSQPPPRRNISVEPEQKGQRRFVMKLEAAPQLQIGFRAPAAGHPDAAALTVAARVLSGSGGGFGGRGRGGRGGGGGGGTGRLFRSLVLDQEVALNARSSFRPSQYPGLFAVSGTPSPQAGLEALEGAIMQELARLATEPPTDEELARVRNAEDASFIRGLRSDMGLAGSLASAQTLTGDWHNLQREREAIKKVTAADVSRVAREYFVTEHSTVGWLEGTQERSFGGRMR
jgi:predicted Zn-dependent peptidase